MSSNATIQSQLSSIQSQIPEHVRLIAVTKYVTEVEIRQAYEVGMRDFGESKIQDAQRKIEALQDCPGINWHLIGHLQSNKAKLAVQLFDWIHSVDSLKLAKRLDRLAQEQETKPKVCLQVKIRPDPDKYGWTEEQLISDLTILKQLQQIQVKGLMSILPKGLSESEILSAFQDTKILAEKIGNDQHNPIQLNELSMGMSQDYPLAIEAGSTMIRLGRILFPSLSRK